MTRKLIQTPEYLFAVDDSEIKKGDYCINIQRGYIKLIHDEAKYYNRRGDVFKKVISHLPLNGSPMLEGVEQLNSKL